MPHHPQLFLLRSRFMDVSPISGGELLVLKAGYSLRDLKRAMELVTAALERHKEKTGQTPVRCAASNVVGCILVHSLHARSQLERRLASRTQAGAALSMHAL